jgi:riboflavin kinase/FMN adenylyltransferase
VYAVGVHLNNNTRKGMMNIGFRPTIQGTERKIEVNIFDFDENIYNQTITIEFKSFLRDEIKFNSLEELKLQLAKDRSEAINF